MIPLAALAFVAVAAATLSRSKPAAAAILDLESESARKGTPRATKPTGVVLHQMAFSRGRDPRKYLGVTAHYVITTDGTIARLHPHATRLPASDGFNAHTVAIEFAGNFPNKEGKWWRGEKFGRDRLTEAQIVAGRRLLRYLNGKGIVNVYAHRQSSEGRTNDPGPDVWSAIAEWAVRNLGMSDGGPGFHIGSGQPIPSEWRTWSG